MTNILYSEPSEYGQDILDLLALIAALMGNEPVYSKKGILSVLGQMRGKISVIEEGVKRKGIGYFTEGDDALRMVRTRHRSQSVLLRGGVQPHHQGAPYLFGMSVLLRCALALDREEIRGFSFPNNRFFRKPFNPLSRIYVWSRPFPVRQGSCDPGNGEPTTRSASEGT